MSTVVLLGHRWTNESPRVRHPNAQIWGQSKHARSWLFDFDDWDAWFDIHSHAKDSWPDVWKWYTAQNKPIFLTEAVPEIASSITYPLSDVEAEFGVGFLGNGFDYMMAFSLSMGFDKVVMSGVGAPCVDNPNQEMVNKWLAKHATIYHWIGVARCAGVEVSFEGPCIIGPRPPYGYNRNYGYGRAS